MTSCTVINLATNITDFVEPVQLINSVQVKIYRIEIKVFTKGQRRLSQKKSLIRTSLERA